MIRASFTILRYFMRPNSPVHSVYVYLKAGFLAFYEILLLISEMQAIICSSQISYISLVVTFMSSLQTYM